MPTGRTPGFLSSATSQPARNAQYAAYGGDSLEIQWVHSAISSRSAWDSTPHRNSQSRSMTESIPLGPAEPVRSVATCWMTSLDTSSGIGVGTVEYGSNAPFSSPTGGSQRFGCFPQSTSMTSRPVFLVKIVGVVDPAAMARREASNRLTHSSGKDLGVAAASLSLTGRGAPPMASDSVSSTRTE